MKRIIFTGGGTGGHFYPLMAVADKLSAASREEKLIEEPQLYYLGPDAYNQEELNRRRIEFRSVSAGKVRSYFSFKNIPDLFRTGIGIMKALWTVFSIYPDVVFAKGGYASFPVLVAARILQIPVMIHESDSVPGRVNRWAGKFARQIAISYPEAAEYFPEDRVALTGNPIRDEIATPAKSGAREFLEMESDIPVILVLGGSQGSEIINSVILESLPTLLEKYYVIHQVGPENVENVEKTTDFFFSELSREKQNLRTRYKPFGYLDINAMQMAAGAADIVISRAGSAIFEIAAWSVPSILIPLEIAHADHQRKNAYAYASAGAATVIDEPNLGEQILVSELEEIMQNSDIYRQMAQAAARFSRLDAAEVIAEEVLYIARNHK